MTVHQYITNKRFTYANELIKNGTNITEAAQNAGFEKLVVAGEPLAKAQEKQLIENSQKQDEEIKNE